MSRNGRYDDYALQVREVLINCEDPYQLNMTYVCQKMNISHRHLSRRLKEENMTFRTIVDDVKKARCRELMEKGHTNAEIFIEKLGLGDASHFYKKFPKWNGTTFTEYKIQNSAKNVVKSEYISNTCRVIRLPAERDEEFCYLYIQDFIDWK